MTADSSETATVALIQQSEKEANNFLIPAQFISVINIFLFLIKVILNLFDVRYQLRLNDLYDFSSTSVINYDVVLRHLDFLDHVLVAKNL